MASPIAIVGVSAEFPSDDPSSNLDYPHFWPFLLRKGHASHPIPQDRFSLSNFASLITPSAGAFLANPTLFDSLEFGIPPTDAPALPLATRKLIHHAFLALRDSGIDYRAANVGVYTAAVAHDPSILAEPDLHALPATFASIPATVANRVSYHLDLHGPSVPVDTACSSSLTATHLAVQAIRAGECTAAVVGGAQFNLRINEWIQYSASGVLSPDAKCKPFDALADGFARGEGVACIVLKPLQDALRDGDKVYATILGTAINATGSLAPLNAPVASAQQAAMERAYHVAGRSPSEADFVEMHATGTAAGDPTEANWVARVFAKGRHDPVKVGSVKGNVGHLEITAFLASLLKVTHMLSHSVIAPTANFSTPNRRISWDALHAPTAPEPLAAQAADGRALVSLSGFGIGGANGHVVLQGNPPAPRAPDADHQPAGPVLIMSGGLSPRSAAAMNDLLASTVQTTHPSALPLLSKLAGRQARQLTWRSFALHDPAAPASLAWSAPQLAPRGRPPLAFVFSGQGPQHALMGRQLFAKYPAFRESVRACDDAYRAVMGFSLLERSSLFVENTGAPKAGSEWTVTLPALTILQIALFDLLGSVGVKPDVVLGHSAGETALLYASGAGSRQMAVEVAIARARMMSVAEDVGGGMAAVACGEVEAQAMIDDVLAKEGIFDQATREQSLVLACYNSPDGVSVAGLVPLVDALCALAETRGVLARRLRIPVPVHSYLMDVCKDECTARVGAVFARYPHAGAPTTPTYSTVTGALWTSPFSTDYFWRNARQPVRFAQVTAQLATRYPAMCYVEISPHPVLSAYVSSAGVDPARITCPARRPARSGAQLEGAAFLESLGVLAAHGTPVDFDALNGHPAYGVEGGDGDEAAVALPPYPFALKHVPFHADSPAFQRLLAAPHGPLNAARLRVGGATHPLLVGHVVNAEPIMPAAGFIEMALEFGGRVVEDAEFLAALALPRAGEVPATVEVALDGARWSVRTASAHGGKGSQEFDRVHSRGLLSFTPDHTDDAPLDLAAIRARCPRECRVEDLYEHGFKGFADYAAPFKRITDAVQGHDEVLATLRGAVDLPAADTYRFDPVVLDAVFHGCMFFIMEHEQYVVDYEARDYFLPSKAARVVLHDALAEASLPERIVAHFVLTDWTPQGIAVDIFITDLTGDRLCTIRGFEMARHSNSVPKPVARRFQLEWQPVSIPLRPAGELLHVRELKHDTRALWRALDALAIECVKRTLAEGGVVVGVERHRQRYWDWAQAAAMRPTDRDALEPEVLAVLRVAYPAYFDVTERVAKVHPDIFTSSTATVQALYSNVDIMQDFYGPRNTVVPSCEESAIVFRKLLAGLAASGKKVIRVLEVGCGTGMLTQHLVDVLPEFPQLVVEYVATDISLGLAMQAAQRFAHPYMRAAAYDLTKTLEEQGIAPASFDIVSALHVLHATADLAQTMTSISELLVPGGYVLTVDFDGDAWQNEIPGTLWYDFIFGGFQEWFDYGEDRTSHCTISLAHWRRLLKDNGFNCVAFSCSHPDEDHSLVFLAQKASADHQVLPPAMNGHINSLPNGKTPYIPEIFASPDLSRLHIHKDVLQPSQPIFTYSRGKEMTLRDDLAALDAAEALSVWIVATDGPDGDAARGLTRTLGKELPVWNIHLVICEPSWSSNQRRSAVAKLQALPSVEPEIRIDMHGSIQVPRVVPLSAPQLEESFDAAGHWVQDGSAISHSALPVLGQFDVAVDVSQWSSLDAGHPRAFLGTIANTGTTTDFAVGDYVMGITDAPLSNRLVVHSGSIVTCEATHARLLADAPGLAVAALALGPGTIRRRGRLGAIRHVLVCDAHTSIGQAAARFYVKLGLDVFCAAEGEEAAPLAKALGVPLGHVSVASNAIWVARQRCLYDVVLSGANNKPDVQTVAPLVTPQGSLCLWNDESHGLAHSLKQDPWNVALALEVALQVLPEDFTSHTAPVPVVDAVSIQRGTLVPNAAPLFDPRKSYLLIGGIGGLGVQMALWMYENGARDIILTSRRGRESLRRTNQTASLRTIQYLERLADLSLSLEAVDATDHEATANLLRSIQKPIGGCFLMSLVLSDKSFTNQTEEDFEKVFEAKTTAFQNIIHSVDVSSFDFFVSFSSVAALFGSAGQSNYTSASSSLEGMTSKLPNAFSLVVPGITDSGWLVRDQRGDTSRSGHLLQWGMSTRELCDCLADGIRKLHLGPFDQYVPNLDWNLIRHDLGAQPSFQHLCIAERTESANQEDGEEKFDLVDMVRSALNIPLEDFSPAVPFTAYGLDSLVAVRLSAAIRAQTGLKVSQMQLLADMTLDDLERKIEDMTLEMEPDAEPEQ